MGSASRSLAAHILALLSPLPSTPRLLDNACGTGAVTCEMLKIAPDALIQAVDNSQGMIDIVKTTVIQNDWQKHVNVGVMAGQRLGFPDKAFEFSITNLGVFFFPDPVKGVREIYRTLKVGGTAVVTCWKSIGFLPIFYEVQKIVKPAVPIHSMPVLEKWMKREILEGTMKLGGFSEVRLEKKEVLLTGESERELVAGLADNMKGIIGDQWSEDEKLMLEAATREILDEQGEKFCVNLRGKKAVKMVAWIALAKRLEFEASYTLDA